MHPQRLVPVFSVVIALVAFAPAAAHQVNIFAYADGATIHGEVYARGGEPIRQAEVTVLDEAGAVLGKTTTDEEGRFTFEALARRDHRLMVDAGAGHAAEYTLAAGELPDALPGPDGEPEREVEKPSTQPSLEPQASSLKPLCAELEAIKQQVIQLRRELNERHRARRLQDVLGAIGYIVGLAGVAFYFLGVKKQRERGDTRAEP